MKGFGTAFAGLALAALAAAATAQVHTLATPMAPLDPLRTSPLLTLQEPLSLSVNDVVALTSWNEDREKHGDEQYQPSVGQAGKDVIWVPTPESLVKALLTAARVTKDDFVVDLGSGDGRFPIAAARDFGARAHGIDYNPDMVALARRNAERAGVRTKVTFARGDVFQSDFSAASVVTLYLLPNLNLKLRPTLLAMKPGTRIVSHAFDMGDWEPDETIRTDDATGYLWIVPAKVDGRWAFEIGNERFASTLKQTYQVVETNGGQLSSGRVRGRQVTFVLKGGREITGEINDSGIAGRGWTATRIAG
ncbi:MAG: methyltransferase domain-containing protein [Sphingomonadaceae bacterium]